MITTDQARAMNIHDLKQHASEPLVARQIELRERAEQLVRGVLRTVGASSYGADWRGYTGTSGWHVTAYVTPDRQIGFVNIAMGRAVLTDVQLDAATVEALTVPSQGEGVKASGAAAWSAPDVGIAQLKPDADGVFWLTDETGIGEMIRISPEAPRGWVQLVLDLRDFKGTAVPVPCTSHVCAWGLRTCYEGRRGAPGGRTLDGGSDKALRAKDWPLTREQRQRLRATGEPILRRMALHLAELAGVREGVESALGSPLQEDPAYAEPGSDALRLPKIDIAAAIRATERDAWHPSAYDAASALRGALNSTSSVVADALRRCGAGRISAVSGDVSNVGGLQYWDLHSALLERILVRGLSATATALWAAAEPHVVRTRSEPEQPGRASPTEWWLHQRVVQPLIKEIAPTLADEVLRDLVQADSVTDHDFDALCGALYAEGYIEINVALESDPAA